MGALSHLSNINSCMFLSQYKIDCRVTIELLDTETDDPEKTSVSNTAKWSSYVDQLANPGPGCNQSAVTASSNNTSSQQRRSSSISTDLEIKKETLDVDMVSVN